MQRINRIKPSYGAGRAMTSNSRKTNIAGHVKAHHRSTPRYDKPGLYGGYGARVPRCNKPPQGLIINKNSGSEQYHAAKQAIQGLHLTYQQLQELIKQL